MKRYSKTRVSILLKMRDDWKLVYRAKGSIFALQSPQGHVVTAM